MRKWSAAATSKELSRLMIAHPWDKIPEIDGFDAGVLSLFKAWQYSFISDASEELLEKRRAVLDELTRISQEMGLYDEDFDHILIKRQRVVCGAGRNGMSFTDLPIIDGEAAPYPRPRTLAQEVEVQRRRCRPCVKCGHLPVKLVSLPSRYRDGLVFWRMACEKDCWANPGGVAVVSLAKGATSLWNAYQRPPGTKATRAFDALKARLKAANEKIQRAEAHAAHLAELWTHLKAENVQLLMRIHGLAD